MKKQLRALLKTFFNLKSINTIDIETRVTHNGRWIVYKIEFFTLRKNFNNKTALSYKDVKEEINKL